MIDKLELRVLGSPNSGVPFTDEFGELFARIRNDEKINPFRSSRYYQQIGDLREFGFDAVLHLWNSRGKTASHKIELLDTGTKTLSRLIFITQSIFKVDALRLKIMRIDLAVDIPKFPVSHFHRNVRIRYKRWQDQYGKLDFRKMGMGKMETLYFGKRPNLIRIYDKTAERMNEYKKILRNSSPDQDPPSFEEIYGVPNDGRIITRLERQIGGGRIPPEIESLEKCKEALPAFDVFSAIDLQPLGALLPEPKEYGIIKFLAGSHLRDRVEEHGVQSTRKFINEHSNGQGARVWRALQDFLPRDSCENRLTASNLRDRFYASVRNQLET